MSDPVVYRDANAQVPQLMLKDGGVFYLDGKPVTNPAHLAILPPHLLASHQSHQAVTGGVVSNDQPTAQSPASCEECGVTYTSTMTPARHRRRHKPVAV